MISVVIVWFFIFFCFKQKTAYEMRISDWSSDVCSSDLLTRTGILWSGIVEHGPITFDLDKKCGVTGAWPRVADFNNGKDAIGTGPYKFKSYVKEIGRESGRERVCQYG